MRAVPGRPSPQPIHHSQAGSCTKRRARTSPPALETEGEQGAEPELGREGPTSTDRHQSCGGRASAQGTPLGVRARGP